MAAIVDLPVKLKSPAQYRAMTYQQLLSCLNDINAMERFLPVETYRLHKALIGSLMSNIQRRACMTEYARLIDAAERHIMDIEARLAGGGA